MSALGRDSIEWRHSERFRKVSNVYPRKVAMAYGGDLEQAMADDDLAVAATVTTWEAAQGFPTRDYHTIGQLDEGRKWGVV